MVRLLRGSSTSAIFARSARGKFDRAGTQVEPQALIGAISKEELLEERVPAASLCRFTRKVVPVVGGFTWVEDDRFRIEHHVLEDTRSLKDSHQLRHYLMALMSRGMNVNRPLWDLHVLPNFDKGRETVLVARVHQASDAAHVHMPNMFIINIDTSEHSSWSLAVPAAFNLFYSSAAR